MLLTRSVIAAWLSLFLGSSAVVASEFLVVDGDTIKDGTTTYRLHGIDAPEAGQTCVRAGGGTWPCGKAAVSYMEGLVLGRDVSCIRLGTDDYGRALAVCHADGVELNAAMIEASLAWSFRKYSSDYNNLEDTMRSAGQGIWQAATETPWDYRAKKWQVGAGEAPEGCPIKGNISSKGERIYHAPWSPWYSRTKISLEKGERWFCDEGEAIEAGWRAPRWGR